MSARSYSQNCALAIALDLIGERWTLLIVRELLLGPRRFKDLLGNLPGLGTNLLSDRLAHLTATGIAQRERPGGGHPQYRLTDLGSGLESVVHALIRWGMRFPERRATARHTRGEWNILPLRALFDPEAGREWSGAYRVVVDGHESVVEYRDGALALAAGDTPVLGSIELSSETAAGITAGTIDTDEALRAGALRTDGDETDVARFFAAFTDPSSGTREGADKPSH